METFKERIESELKPLDIEELYCDAIDEDGPFEIGYIQFDKSRILRELDPIAYRVGMNDFSDSFGIEFEGEYYDQDEFEKVKSDYISEVESEIDDLESGIEQLENRQSEIEDQDGDPDISEEYENLEAEVTTLREQIEELKELIEDL